MTEQKTRTDAESVAAIVEGIKSTIDLGMKLFDIGAMNMLSEQALGAMIQGWATILPMYEGGQAAVDDLVMDLVLFANTLEHNESARLTTPS